MSAAICPSARRVLTLPARKPIETAPETRSFNGDFLLYRKDGSSLKRRFTGEPRFRHKTMASAETEAARLLELFPESTFVILQEVGRVKMKVVTNG